MTRAILFETTEADIGGMTYAHVGFLTRPDYEAISAARNERNLRCDAMMTAIREVCA